MDNFLDDVIGEGVPNLDWKNSFDVPMSLDDAGLNPYEFRIWCHLAKRAAKKGVAWPSVRTMAKHLKLSRTTVIRSLQSLQQKKLLVISHRQRENGSAASNVYGCAAPEQRGVVSEIDGGGPPQIPGWSTTDTPSKLLKEETLKKETKKDSQKMKQNNGQPLFPEVERAVDAHSEDTKLPAGMPYLSMIKTYLKQLGFPESDADSVYDAWLACEFRDGHNRKIRDWKASIRVKAHNNWLPSQKLKPRGLDPEADRQKKLERMRQIARRSRQ